MYPANGATGNLQNEGIQVEIKNFAQPTHPVGKRNNKLILTLVILRLVNIDSICVCEQLGS